MNARKKARGGKPDGFLLSPWRAGLLILLVLLVLAAPASAGVLSQSDIYRLAYLEGKTIGYPETILAIAIHESRGGTYNATPQGVVGDKAAGFGKRSYGIMQVKLETARDVLKAHPELGSFPTDEHLLVALLTDPVFNIRVAALYFKMQIDRFHRHWRRALIAYNAGPSNAEKMRDPLHYADNIWRTITQELPRLGYRRAK